MPASHLVECAPSLLAADVKIGAASPATPDDLPNFSTLGCESRVCSLLLKLPLFAICVLSASLPQLILGLILASLRVRSFQQAAKRKRLAAGFAARAISLFAPAFLNSARLASPAAACSSWLLVVRQVTGSLSVRSTALVDASLPRCALYALMVGVRIVVARRVLLAG